MAGPTPRNLGALLSDQASRTTALERRLPPVVDESPVSISQSGAMDWMRQMMEPNLRPLYRDIIELDRPYSSTYTGGIDASFALPADRDWGSTPGTWITISDPGDLMPNFRGTVYGRLVRPGDPTGGANKRVYAGKVTDNFYPQKYATTDSNGYFSIDLSTVATSVKGEWGFRATDATGATPYGNDWPATPITLSAVVQLESIGDASDITKEIPAPLDGKVHFPSSTPGLKRVRLVDPTVPAGQPNLLAMTELVTGNIRSYGVSSGQPGYGTRFEEQSYVYDQALALMAAVARRDEVAHKLADGIMRLQTTSGTNVGGFRFSGRQESAQYGDPAYRTGAHAFAVHALCAYILAFPLHSRRAEAAVTKGLSWVVAQAAPTGSNRAGLYLGGNGVYTPDGDGGQSFQENYPLTWASTEHNIDVYFMWRIAARALKLTALEQYATLLKNNMMAKLWNEELGRLNQGLQETGPDTADPLDIHSWGSIFLADIGESAKAQATMSPSQLEPFYYETTAPNGEAVSGYATSYDSPGYPGMLPHVWWEGTFSVAYALKKLGEDGRAAQVIAGANPGQFADGSFPYVAPSDPGYELYPYRAVASTAWSVLANLGYGVFDLGAL
ncbi:hypothetical protein SEA_FRANSOYER_42 [Microbacterium phage Fransoyer]|nr:minor tail protein [Microbacterium phage RubyRalph]UUG69607.1 hypothetical protein SEA_FRANSOYER_42 [Microbacterium phage Fransoyer]